MKYISWLITIPLTVLALVFIISNQDRIDVHYWIYAESYSLPLYFVGLFMLGVGFFCGALFVSISAYSLRHEHWKTKRHLKRLQAELENQTSTNNDTGKEVTI